MDLFLFFFSSEKVLLISPERNNCVTSAAQTYIGISVYVLWQVAKLRTHDLHPIPERLGSI